MEQNALIFGEDCINKNTFHKSKRTINIDEVNINPLKAIGNLSCHIFDIQSYCNIFSFSG